mmetsp:Transcript_78986/g.124666  ORF Transcript_78986/g.124666 Transcript_78986/m.124666 type:complete len:216 (-) Transcript_78986:131-778(-)
MLQTSDLIRRPALLVDIHHPEVHLGTPLRELALVATFGGVGGVVDPVRLVDLGTAPAELHHVLRNLQEGLSQVRGEHQPMHAGLLLVRILALLLGFRPLSFLCLVTGTIPPGDQRPGASAWMCHPAMQSVMAAPGFPPASPRVLGDENVGMPTVGRLRRRVDDSSTAIIDLPLDLKHRHRLVRRVHDDLLCPYVGRRCGVYLVGDFAPTLAAVAA